MTGTRLGAFFVFDAEDIVHDRRPTAYGGHDHMPVNSLGYVGGLVATVSLISWIGTPLLLMIDTAVWRPSWACQWPMPAFLVILEKRQLSASEVYGVPFSWQNTRSLSCQASPASLRSRSCLDWCPLSAVTARFGRVRARDRALLAGRGGLSSDHGSVAIHPVVEHIPRDQVMLAYWARATKCSDYLRVAFSHLLGQRRCPSQSRHLGSRARSRAGRRPSCLGLSPLRLMGSRELIALGSQDD
jgi:hypothetical protein